MTTIYEVLDRRTGRAYYTIDPNRAEQDARKDTHRVTARTY